MKIADLTIYADEFHPAASTVLISHYHRDHLRGLPADGGPAPVLTSPLTATLLRAIDGVPMRRMTPIATGSTYFLQDGEREVALTAYDANHCPGALMFLLEWEGRRALYTGDFRLNDRLRALAHQIGEVDWLYLDTTYDDPQYVFPPPEAAVEQVLELLRRRAGPAMVAIYSLGKNRILEAAVDEFKQPFYMAEGKRRIYEAIGMGRLVTDRRAETPFRAYARGYLEHYFRLSPEYEAGRCTVVIPTGWAMGRSSGEGFHYVPYSEHCSFEELEEFRSLVRAKRTVSIIG